MKPRVALSLLAALTNLFPSGLLASSANPFVIYTPDEVRADTRCVEQILSPEGKSPKDPLGKTARYLYARLARGKRVHFAPRENARIQIFGNPKTEFVVVTLHVEETVLDEMSDREGLLLPVSVSYESKKTSFNIVGVRLNGTVLWVSLGEGIRPLRPRSGRSAEWAKEPVGVLFVDRSSSKGFDGYLAFYRFFDPFRQWQAVAGYHNPGEELTGPSGQPLRLLRELPRAIVE